MQHDKNMASFRSNAVPLFLLVFVDSVNLKPGRKEGLPCGNVRKNDVNGLGKIV
jgi:hypothetical protein